MNPPRPSGDLPVPRPGCRLRALPSPRPLPFPAPAYGHVPAPRFAPVPPSPRSAARPTLLGPLPAPPEAEHAPERRLRDEGAERLSTAELLEVLLGRGGAPAGETARAVLDRFESLRRLGVGSIAELCAAGLVAEQASRLAAAFALGRRALAEPLVKGAAFRTSADIYERYHPLLRDARRERFVAILLDGKNRVMRDETISEGSLTSSLVHPREVFAPAIRESAGAMVFVHNHPSGDPEPSPEDVDITRRLCAVGEVVGIRVLDHVVIGDSGYVSFLDRGWV